MIAGRGGFLSATMQQGGPMSMWHAMPNRHLKQAVALLTAFGLWQSLVFAAVQNNGAEMAAKNAQLKQLFELTQTRSYQKARLVADKLLKDYPNDFDIHLAVAALYRDMGQVSSAESEYKRVLKIAPRASDAMVALSQISMQKLDTEQALQWARLAANTSPRSTTARLALLRALVDCGLLREGEELVNELLKQNADDPDIQYAAYKFYLRQGNLSRAQEHIESAIKAGPARFDWLVDLSDVCKAEGDYAHAQIYLEKALNHDPYSIDALNKLAIVLEFFTHDYDHAIEIYQRILSIDPESVTALAGLDRCKVKKHDLASALRLQIRSFGASVINFFTNTQPPQSE